MENLRTDRMPTQVTSLTPPSSLSTLSPRCTSSSSTASPAPSTARSSGMSSPQLARATLATRISNTNAPQSVRSREGRRNRAPPPRVRFNKDGKKINPLQTGKVAGAAA
jgi:hypothetical protein